MSDNTKIIEKGTWVVNENTSLNTLTIAEESSIEAPDGKYVTLTVDGIGTPIQPGVYTGDVRLTVCDNFIQKSMRFGEETISNFRAGVCISDGKRLGNSSVAAVVSGGTVTDRKAEDVTIKSNEWDFSGFYITGDSEYTIENAIINLNGDGTDDFVGLGAAIAAAGNSKVTVNNTEIHTDGITRPNLFVGGRGEVIMNDCQLSTVSYEPTEEQLAEGAKLQRMMQPPWAIGLRGYGRTINLAGWGVMHLNRCHVTSNNWGVLSVDGAIVNRMYVRDSLIELLGENGYGCFSICDDFLFDYKAFGDYGCIDVIDHSTFNVPTYGIMMSLGNSCGDFINGSVVNSGRFGAFIFRNSGGKLRVNSKSVFNTDEACVLVKGSNVYMEFDDCKLNSKNGMLIQMIDNDDPGMGNDPFLVPVGEIDIPDGRDLTTAIADEDVFVTISNMDTVGDIMNSTTNLKANCRRDPNALKDAPPIDTPMDFGDLRGMGEDLQGAKNLDLKILNASIKGVISSATAKYKDSVTMITQENCEELSNVTQTPSSPVNNGVIVTVDGKSTWTVTGTSYLTKLVIENGAKLVADQGLLVMKVDGIDTAIEPGTYKGVIEMRLDKR